MSQGAETFEEWTYYVGDPHVHTGVSGDGGSEDLGDCSSRGCGDFDTVFTDARANGLDWIGVSDHSNGMPHPTSDADEFNLLISKALEANDPDGGFITLPSAEVWNQDTVLGNLGHLTMAFYGDDEDLAGLEITDFQPSGSSSISIDTCEDLFTWLEEIKAEFGDVTVVPHHPAAKAPMPTNWACFDPTWEPAVEVYSEHGSSLFTDDSFDPMWSGVRPSGTVHNALDPDGYGLQMGFMAGSDSHDTRPGKICQTDTMMRNHPYGGGHTMVVLDKDESFTRGAIYDAMYARHTYATSGPHVPVVQEYRTGGALIGRMGDALGVPSGQSLEIQVRISPDYLDAVTEVSAVYMDDTWDLSPSETEEATWDLSLGAEEIPPWIYVVLTFDGDLIYGEDGCDDGGTDNVEKVWLSPSWISEAEPDLDRDGVTWADGDCDDGNASAYPGAEEILYDGIDEDCDGDEDEDGCDLIGEDGRPSHGDVDEIWYDGWDQDCDGNDDDQDYDGYALGVDCEDTDPGVNPAVTEIWYDGRDQDCDGNDDDQDGDGYGVDEDCDDLAGDVSPGAREIWYDGYDQDCDGNDDDRDSDGYSWFSDCDERDPDINPASREIWYDGHDQDCDGNDADQDGDGYTLADDCDDGDPAISPSALEIWYDRVDQDCDGDDADQDGDGYGVREDCDDLDGDVSPGNREIWYDGIDQDCDGNDDDQDHDGFALGEDCDDADPWIKPSAPEIWYDGVDQDCDGNDADQDGDGFSRDQDCDDTDFGRYPGHTEVWLDGIDQDCDGHDRGALSAPSTRQPEPPEQVGSSQTTLSPELTLRPTRACASAGGAGSSGTTLGGLLALGMILRRRRAPRA